MVGSSGLTLYSSVSCTVNRLASVICSNKKSQIPVLLNGMSYKISHTFLAWIVSVFLCGSQRDSSFTLITGLVPIIC